MDQPYKPVESVDPDIQEPGRQEGAGNGYSLNWMQKVKLKIIQAAEGVSLTSLPSNLQRFDQMNTKQPHPSIFMPRRPVAVAPPMPTVAQTASQQPLDHTGAAASSRGSNGSIPAVEPYHHHQVAIAEEAPMPIIAQTASQQPLDHNGATASSRGSTNGIVVAVGPYHHHQSESQPPLITHEKKCAIVEFLARPEFRLDIEAFLKWARGEDAKVREYYEQESVTMLPDELAVMLLLDGCLVLFAVFLLRKSSVRKDQRLYPSCLEKDISWSTRTRGHTKLAQDFINLSRDISMHKKLTRLDLLLLGNQIPFFVLEELHTQLKKTFFKGIKRNIQELALSCFEDIRPSPNPNPSPSVLFPPEVHHLLHLFHWSRVPPNKHAVDPSSPLLGDPESNLPCATWFEDSHISLSKHAAAPGRLNMVFQRSMLGARGVLHVPALHIHAYSELVFHNLIAFEQSHLCCGLAVTTYCICMARLLQSEADARLLRKRGILAHTHETDKDIVNLFRGLGDEYRRDAFYSRDLLDLCGHVEAHHHSKAARAVKWVVLQCFPRQTVTFFVILGALISIATLINTIVSVYRFYHPGKQSGF